jgi:hypothetical protein
VADTEPTDGASPFGQRGFVLAAVFMAVLVLAGLGLLLTDPDEDPEARAGSSRPPAVEPAKGAKADGSDSRCGLEAGDQRIPATPPEAGWELVGRVATPQSDAIGPGIREAKRRMCYAHSPTGALFAAVNFLAVAGEQDTNDELMKALTAKTAARDELLARPDDGTDAEAAKFRIQIAGFRIGPATPDEATVEVAVAFADQAAQAYVGYTLPMRWEDGDWKLVITSPDTPFTLQRLESASGFVPWSAQ